MKKLISFIKKMVDSKESIFLHEPIFEGNEKKYLCDAIDSTYVSSVGPYVNKFEKMISKVTGAKFSVATINGTSALHAALLVAGANNETEIITQPLTFVATANAISYTGSKPIFIDVDKDTMGMSPRKLRKFLENNSKIFEGKCMNKKTGKQILACVPMHTFGFPCRIQEIKSICDEFNICLIEDSAEGLGSKIKNKSVGTFGLMGVFSFNGNKIITTGGGGAIITNNPIIYNKIKHITTTSKVLHKWEYVHDEIGFNYRMPNINAALGCAQLEKLDEKLERKNKLSIIYKNYLKNSSIIFFEGIKYSKPNNWLMTIIFSSKEKKEKFLALSNESNVMTRPVWRLMNRLEMYNMCECDNINNSIWLSDRVVNIPSNLKIN
jgi:aminotransferase in exopolysaccharide biosynthesis